MERLTAHSDSLESLAQIAVMGQPAIPASASQARWEDAHTLVQPSPAQYLPASLPVEPSPYADAHCTTHAQPPPRTASPEPTPLATPNASMLRPSRRAPKPPAVPGSGSGAWLSSPMQNTNTRARIDVNGRVVIETIGPSGNTSEPVLITNYVRSNTAQ